ncbi:MAG: hypothetical protein RLP44_28010 [Aggregatilineales bacterium]
MESTVPVFPCQSLTPVLEFYQTLGFEVEHQQESPYLYGAVRRGEVILHFSRLSVMQAKHGVCLVFVPEVADYHTAFSNALREKYARIPTAGYPRITRWHTEHTRFHIFDPAGNVLIFINNYEPSQEYGWSEENLSPMVQAIENAMFLRDTYCHDSAAAKVLDKALKQHPDAINIERARALALRAELALALGDDEQAHALQQKSGDIPISEEDRRRYDIDLSAPHRLRKWLSI